MLVYSCANDNSFRFDALLSPAYIVCNWWASWIWDIPPMFEMTQPLLMSKLLRLIQAAQMLSKKDENQKLPQNFEVFLWHKMTSWRSMVFVLAWFRWNLRSALSSWLTKPPSCKSNADRKGLNLMLMYLAERCSIIRTQMSSVDAASDAPWLSCT